MNQAKEIAYSFFIKQPVAVYWGLNENEKPYYYAGIVTDLNNEEVTVTLHDDSIEVIPSNEFKLIIPLKINPSTSEPLSKADVNKIIDRERYIRRRPSLNETEYLDKYTKMRIKS